MADAVDIGANHPRCGGGTYSAKTVYLWGLAVFVDRFNAVVVLCQTGKRFNTSLLASWMVYFLEVAQFLVGGVGVA
jgi:hypothetical protein